MPGGDLRFKASWGTRLAFEALKRYGGMCNFRRWMSSPNVAFRAPIWVKSPESYRTGLFSRMF